MPELKRPPGKSRMRRTAEAAVVGIGLATANEVYEHSTEPARHVTAADFAQRLAWSDEDFVTPDTFPQRLPGIWDDVMQKTRLLNQRLHTMQHTPESIQSYKEAYWTEIRSALPELQLPEYAEEQFQKFLLLDLPKALANYGFYISVIPEPVSFPDQTNLTSADPLIYFFTVDSVETQSFERWGTTVNVDMVVGHQVVPREFSFIDDQLALSQRRDVFLNLPAADIIQGYYYRLLTTDGVTYQEYSDESIWRALETYDQSSVGPRGASFLRLVRELAQQYKVGDPFPIIEETLEHELGHVMFNDAASSQAPYNIQPEDSARVLQRKMDAWGFNHEISAFLTQLRYSPAKLIAVHTLLRNIEASGDARHTLAATWVLDELLKEVLQQPERFGVQFRVGSRLSRYDQAMVQLVEIAEHPHELEAAITEIYQAHQQQPVSLPPALDTSATATIRPTPQADSRLGQFVCNAFALSVLIGAASAAVQRFRQLIKSTRE